MIRLFKHYVPHTVLWLGVIDFVLLLLAAGEAGWLLRLWQIGGGVAADAGAAAALFAFAVDRPARDGRLRRLRRRCPAIDADRGGAAGGRRARSA